jgi:hypothetical protein
VAATSFGLAPSANKALRSKSIDRPDCERRDGDSDAMRPEPTPSLRFTYEDFLHAEGAITRAAEFSAKCGDVLTTPLLPEFSVPLADVFSNSIGVGPRDAPRPA